MGACSTKPVVNVDAPTADTAAGTFQKAVFFPDEALPCRHYLRGEHCRRKHCNFSHKPTSLTVILHELAAAQQTLDVCVFTITCNEIADAVEAAAKKGVAVRIITDDEQAKSQGSDVQKLSKIRGISVRHDGNTHAFMHHKYAIVDGVTLLNGSFNWTRSAVLMPAINHLLRYLDSL